MSQIKSTIAVVLICVLLFPVMTGQASVASSDCSQLLSLSVPNVDTNGTKVIESDNAKELQLMYDLTPNPESAVQRGPMDVVLIAETAETMAQDFDGNELPVNSSDPNQRINAMKNSLKKFVQLMNKSNLNKSEKDRVALIKFDTAAEVRSNFTENYNDVLTKIEQLSPVNPQDEEKIGKNFGQAFSIATQMIRNTQKNIPLAPQKLSFNGLTDTSVTIEWDSSLDVTNLLRYELYRSKDSMFNYTKILETIATSYTDTNIVPSSTYDYYVLAVDKNGVQSKRSQVLRITTKVDVTPPTAPVKLQLSKSDSTSAEFNWSAALDNSGVRHYQVFLNGNLEGTTTSLSYAFHNLTADNVYSVAVRAVDLKGLVSSASNVVTFRTPNKKKFTFFYRYNGFSIPEIRHRHNPADEWTTKTMDISEAFGLYKKDLEIDANRPLYAHFRYIDNRANFYPNFFEAYQPRRKKFDLFGNLIKTIGSNPKPLLVSDDNAPFYATPFPHASHLFTNRAEGSGTFYAGVNSVFTEKLDEHTDEVVKTIVNPVTNKTVISNTVTIYYKSGGPMTVNTNETKRQPFRNPFIHFSIDGVNWTNDPGLKMTPSKIAGYHYITIDLGETSKLSKMAFNDGNANAALRKWQNDNGNNFFNKINDKVMVYDPVTQKLYADNPNDHNIAVIYYKSNRYTNTAQKHFYQSPHIHYTLDGTQWTGTNGLKMSPSMIAGYHYLSIDLGANEDIERFAFSDGTFNDSQGDRRFFNKIKPGIKLYDPETNTIVDKSPFQFIQNQNVARVYYKSDELYTLSGMSALENPHIHYSMDGSRWTTLPGIPMVPSTVTGYHTTLIPLGSFTSINQAAFTDGNGNWQNNGGRNFPLPRDYSVYYPVSSTLVSGSPREVVGRKINHSQMVRGETKMATVYYHSGAVNGIDEPYIHYELNGVWTKAPGEKMYPSELKGYHKFTVPLTNLDSFRAVFTDEKQSLWQKLNGNPVLFSSGTSTYSSVSSTNGKIIASKPEFYEPEDRRKIVIFLSDGLPNVDPNTGKLEGNGNSTLIFGQSRENPFARRLGYTHAREQLQHLVSTGSEVHVIAIGSDNAINIDSAAIDLTFLEYIAKVGRGSFFRAEDAEQFRLNLEGIVSQLSTEKLSEVSLVQSVPSGFTLPGGTNVADAIVNDQVYPNSVTLNNGILKIALNEIPLSSNSAFKIKVNVLSNDGGVFKLNAAKLEFPYTDMNCSVSAKESYEMRLAAVRYDMYGNKYVGKIDGTLSRYSVNGGVLQWTIDPFAGDGAKYPIRSIQFANDDTTVRANHHNTMSVTSWDLLPSTPTAVSYMTNDNKFLSANLSNRFIANILPSTRITSVSGSALKSPLLGSTPLNPENMLLYNGFLSSYIKGYEYSLDGGKSWSNWNAEERVVVPSNFALQTHMFRAFTDAVSGIAKTGDEFSTSFKYRLPNEPPKVTSEPPVQNELTLNGVRFANRTNDMSLTYQIADDTPVSDDFRVTIDGNPIDKKLLSIESLDSGFAKKITLQWSTLFADEKVRQGDKKINVSYRDEGGLTDAEERTVGLNVGPYVSLVNASTVTSRVHNRPVPLRFDWRSMVSGMKLTAPEYQIINRPISFTGTPPEPSATGWKKLGSRSLTVSSSGVNFVYVRLRDSKNLSSMENGYSSIHKRAPVRVRINYNINIH